jgi:hypothetical protein
MNKPVLINGVKSNIQTNKSKGKKWSFEKCNFDTLKILDELFKSSNSSVIYPKGLTIINPIGTIDLVNLGVTRPSNHIGILRSEIGENSILTYYQRGKRKPFYGAVKSKNNLLKFHKLRAKILDKISMDLKR